MKIGIILGVVFLIALLGISVYYSVNDSSKNLITGKGTTTYTINGNPAFEDASGKYIVSVTPYPLTIEINGGNK